MDRFHGSVCFKPCEEVGQPQSKADETLKREGAEAVDIPGGEGGACVGG